MTTCGSLHCKWPALHGTDSCWSHTSPLAQKAFAAATSRLSGTQHNYCAHGADFLDIVLESVNFTNKSEFIQARFTGAVLRDVTFHDADLTAIDFRGARLFGVTFTDCKLTSANFEGAELESCTFRSGDARQSTFSRARFAAETSFVSIALHETSFEACSFAGRTTYRDCRAPAVRFTHARAVSIEFQNCELDRSDFREVVFDRKEHGPLFKGPQEGERRLGSLTNCDFRGAILQVPSDQAARHTFRSISLRGSTFSGAHMDRCVFSGAGNKKKTEATSCNFEDADLDGAEFHDIDLSGSSYSGCALKDTKFCNATISGARLENMVAVQVVFANTTAKAALFTSCILEDCAINGGAFDGADFSRSSVSSVTLHAESMKGCGFRGTHFKGVSFSGDFSEAAFDQATFTTSTIQAKTKFEGAVFRGVDWRQVAAHGQNFDRADFREADLHYADFTSATLKEAQLAGANVTGAKFDCATMRNADLTDLVTDTTDPPTPNGGAAVNGTASFRRANLRAAVLRRSRLRGADLTQALLSGVVAEDADLVGATLCGADLSNAVFDRCTFADRSDSEQVRVASMCGVTATGASFVAACFAGVRLAGVKMEDANLQNAVLRHAKVLDAKSKDGTHSWASSFNGARLIGTVGPIEIDAEQEGNRNACDTCQMEPQRGRGRFRHAYISATEYLLSDRDSGIDGLPRDWASFREWINGDKKPPSNGAAVVVTCTSRPDASPPSDSTDGHTGDYPRAQSLRPSDPADPGDEARASWVAWKNNFSSLGWYDLQSECFVEEQLTCSPRMRLLHELKTPLLQDIASMSVFSLLLVAVLLLCGGTYFVIDGFARAPQFLVVIVGILLILRAAPLLRPLLYVLHGFGERPQRIFLNAVAALGIFGLSFLLVSTFSSAHGVVHSNGTALDNPWDALYFGAVTFTTLGYGDYTPYGLSRLLAGCESFTGLLMAALFVTALARRTSGR